MASDPDMCMDCGKYLLDTPSLVQRLDGRCGDEHFACRECCATSEDPCEDCLLEYDFSERTA